MAQHYRFELLRYAPNRLSGEFYNIAVLVYGEDGRLLEGRFAPDLVRLRCHPLADLPYLEALRAEFEQRRREGFARYIEELKKNLSASLELSDPAYFVASGDRDMAAEMERLVRTYLATPRRSEVRAAEPAPDTRRWIRARMRDTFALYHVLDRLDADVEVGGYVSPRFSFHIDYASKPNGKAHYFHALSLQHDVTDASRLCFVFDRLRARLPCAMTAVVADAFPDDTRALLASSEIRPWPVSQLQELALGLRQELGL